MADSKLLRSALWYARHGWYVVPLNHPLFSDDGQCVGCSCEHYYRRNRPDYKCQSQGKHPRISSWEEEATTDESTIRRWWSRWPHANVGIAAGKSGLVCFDLDSYKDSYEGEQLLSHDDEDTVTNLSGGGGQHLVYRMPEDTHYSNANSGLPDGIDIRAWGGQFVAPPSIHPSGSIYRWELEYGPHEIEVAPIPNHIAAILDDTKPSFTPAARFGDNVPPKPVIDHWRLSSRIRGLINEPPTKGGRSEADQSVITALVRRGATDEEIRGVFTHYPIGTQGKFYSKGANGLQYLSHSIGHARAYCAKGIIQNVATRIAGRV